VEGARSYSTYQSINFSILSTLYELLSKQLISVLVPIMVRQATADLSDHTAANAARSRID